MDFSPDFWRVNLNIDEISPKAIGWRFVRQMRVSEKKKEEKREEG